MFMQKRLCEVEKNTSMEEKTIDLPQKARKAKNITLNREAEEDAFLTFDRSQPTKDFAFEQVCSDIHVWRRVRAILEILSNHYKYCRDWRMNTSSFRIRKSLGLLTVEMMLLWTMGMGFFWSIFECSTDSLACTFMYAEIISWILQI